MLMLRLGVNLVQCTLPQLGLVCCIIIFSRTVQFGIFPLHSSKLLMKHLKYLFQYTSLQQTGLLGCHHKVMRFVFKIYNVF